MTRFPGARMVDPVRTAGRLWLLVPRTTPADTLCPTRPHGRGAERGRPGRLARQGNCRPDGDKSDITAMLHSYGTLRCEPTPAVCDSRSRHFPSSHTRTLLRGGKTPPPGRLTGQRASIAGRPFCWEGPTARRSKPVALTGLYRRRVTADDPEGTGPRAHPHRNGRGSRPPRVVGL